MATEDYLNDIPINLRDRVMTAEEREEQRRSFAHGNIALHNPAVTREVIDKAADELAAEPARDKVRKFSITVTVRAEDAERIGEELKECVDKQFDATPGYCGSFSFKDEAV